MGPIGAAQPQRGVRCQSLSGRQTRGLLDKLFELTVLGGVEGEEGEKTLRDCSEWVVAQGLPEGEFSYEIAGRIE